MRQTKERPSIRSLFFATVAICALSACTIEVDDQIPSPLTYTTPINTRDFQVRVRSNVRVTDVELDVEGAPPARMAASGSDQYAARVPLPACTGAANYQVIVDCPSFPARTFPRVGRYTRAVHNIPNECDEFPDGLARTFKVDRTTDFQMPNPAMASAAAWTPRAKTAARCAPRLWTRMRRRATI